MYTDGPVRGALIRFLVLHPWLVAGTAAGLLGAVSVMVIVSGVVPIKASAGHWWITEQLLDFAKMRSVATHSMGITPPRLDEAGTIALGAAHYEIGCYPCHGKPGTPVPPIMAAMTPAPPALTSRVGRFQPEELFLIVRHGIKFTGMPAWPAPQRDDEVWAVVAFLQRLPSLDRDAYTGLAGGAGPGEALAAAPRPVRDLCWRCHGADGTGGGRVPSLAGQRAEYLHASLTAFARRTRFSGIMAPIAAGLGDEAMRQVAAYYEALPRPSRGGVGGGAAAPSDDGALLARYGAPQREIPACVECHGPGAVPRNPAYPTLAGQHAEYLRAQLMLLQQRRRGGSPNVELMHVFVDRLSEKDIAGVARHFEAAEE